MDDPSRCRSARRAGLRALLALGLAPALLPLAGCGGSEGGLVPVSGKVTLDGGAWPKPGKITFAPKQEGAGAQLRPASADFDTAGNFTVSSFEGSPGLYPGDYRASVECWEVMPGMANPDAMKDATTKKGMMMPGPGKSYVPTKYQSSESSGFELKVQPGQSATANFDVKTK